MQLAYPSTLVRGQKLGLFLRKQFLGRSQVDSFDDLPIPFRCVATDIGEVRPRVFSSGDLELAIRASMAVPGAFAPVHHEGKVLVDGGIVNNLPVDVARAMGVDLVIVVDVGQPLAPPETVDSTFEILLQMVSGLMRDRSDATLATLGPDDVFIQARARRDQQREFRPRRRTPWRRVLARPRPCSTSCARSPCPRISTSPGATRNIVPLSGESARGVRARR